jgi:hypothetical protein
MAVGEDDDYGCHGGYGTANNDVQCDGVSVDCRGDSAAPINQHEISGTFLTFMLLSAFNAAFLT